MVFPLIEKQDEVIQTHFIQEKVVKVTIIRPLNNQMQKCQPLNHTFDRLKFQELNTIRLKYNQSIPQHHHIS